MVMVEAVELWDLRCRGTRSALGSGECLKGEFGEGFASSEQPKEEPETLTNLDRSFRSSCRKTLEGRRRIGIAWLNCLEASASALRFGVED